MDASLDVGLGQRAGANACRGQPREYNISEGDEFLLRQSERE